MNLNAGAMQTCESHKTSILVNTQVQSHALLRRGFGTAVPFIYKIFQSFMFYVPLYKMCVGTAVHVVEASTLEQKSSVGGCRLPKSG